jgi:hypothetical protein
MRQTQPPGFAKKVIPQATIASPTSTSKAGNGTLIAGGTDASTTAPSLGLASQETPYPAPSGDASALRQGGIVHASAAVVVVIVTSWIAMMA